MIPFNDIVAVLMPHMGNAGARQALVTSALFGCPVLNSINWSGDAQTFTTLLVRQLDTYGECTAGKPALVSLLETLKAQVGSNKQREIDALIAQIIASSNESTQPTSSTPTKTGVTHMAVESGLLVGFLVEFGRWAKNELSERWTLRRKEKEIALEKRADIEAAVPDEIEAIASETNAQDVERTIALIQRKRDAIFRARNAKLTHREERELGEITENMFVLRVEKEDKTIRQMMNEIVDDLSDLGFDVERTTE